MSSENYQQRYKLEYQMRSIEAAKVKQIILIKHSGDENRRDFEQRYHFELAVRQYCLMYHMKLQYLQRESGE